MKAVFSIIFVLILSTALWAQGDSPDCVQCWVAVDYVCNDGFSCLPPSTTCATKTFTAPCNGNYNLACKLLCTTECLHCRGCVTLYDNTVGQQVGSTCWAGGDPNHLCQPIVGGCEPNGQTVTLIANHQYTLTACLARCLPYSCNLDCSNNCRTEAHLWHPQAACPSW